MTVGWLRYRPDYASAFNNLGVIHSQTGDVHLAIDFYLRAISIDPSDADAHYNLAMACISIGDIERAFSAYNSLKAIDPARAEGLRKFLEFR